MTEIIRTVEELELGNAVAVPCVEWIARRIATADRQAVTR